MVGDNADRRCGGRCMGFAVRIAVSAVFQEILRRAAERGGVDCPVADIDSADDRRGGQDEGKSVFHAAAAGEDREGREREDFPVDQIPDDDVREGRGGEFAAGRTAADEIRKDIAEHVVGRIA